ncbi:putative amidoligase enzyme-domain-containing protein [Xylaria flabelliformis]|nr:putative amidoligase enzyme-domain-containing protein [Xylaria flabelliformis]
MADKSPQTLGIELEFIVFYTTPDQPAPAKDDKRYGPVLECPHYSEIPLPPGFEVDEDDYPRRELEAAWVRQKVADVIASAGFGSKASLYAKGPEEDLFTLWNVVPDYSLRLPFDFDQAYMPLEHVGVEVNSPVFVAGEDAFKEISTVVKAINSAFLTTVPPVCGFHVHVGRGHKPLEFRPVQRIASLLWLAENLIDTLHPGCRHGNKYCFGMRHFSNMGAILCSEHTGEHIDWLGKSRHAKLSMDRVDKNRKKPTNYKYNRPLNVTDSQESTLSRIFACEYLVSFWEPLYNELSAGVKMMDGVRMIFSSKDIGEIAHLTSFKDDRRGGYNFANLASEQGANSPRKPTIEFRGAAGSLDADWIVVWAKICLALCGPAVVESSDDDFFQLLYDPRYRSLQGGYQYCARPSSLR